MSMTSMPALMAIRTVEWKSAASVRATRSVAAGVGLREVPVEAGREIAFGSVGPGTCRLVLVASWSRAELMALIPALSSRVGPSAGPPTSSMSEISVGPLELLWSSAKSLSSSPALRTVGALRRASRKWLATESS